MFSAVQGESAGSAEVETAERPAPSGASPVEVRRSSPDLLASVAIRLRELERAANGAAAELRKQAAATEQQELPKSRANTVARAVLHELMLTLSERADGLEHEAELIAGILERAREAILHPAAERAPRAGLVSGRGRVINSSTRAAGATPPRRPPPIENSPESPAPDRSADAKREQRASAGVKLLAAQMALEGQSSDTIQGRLRSEFGISDPGGAVKEVLGGGARS